MGAVGLELNDAGIVAVGDDGALRAAPSPGLALLDGAGLEVGIAAARKARLKPRHVHSRFWDPLDAEPLQPPFPSDSTRADLTHAHLQALWKQVGRGADAAFLAVPGWYGAAQLGLLLGVARACGIPARGLVDAAVAAAVAVGRPGTNLVHVELYLHRAVATELRQGSEVIRGRVASAEGAGLAELHEAWARAVAATFVRRTRFDPLHEARSEQSLYDALPGWLASLSSRPEVELSLSAGGRDHVLELTRAELLAGTAELYDRVAALMGGLRRAGEPVTLLLGQRLASLPGLVDRLADSPGSTPLVLEEGAPARGALCERKRIESRDEALPFVTRLPSPLGGGSASAVAAKAAGTAPAAPRAGRAPSHVLHDGVAVPIGEEPLVVGTAPPEGRRGLTLAGRPPGVSRAHCVLVRRGAAVVVEDQSSYGSFLNEQRIQGSSELRAGDRLRLGAPGVELLLIAVEPT